GDDGLHRLVNPAVAGDQINTRRQPERPAIYRRHDAAGLLNEQDARSYVPAAQLIFPVAVEPARGDVGQIQSSSTAAAQALGALENGAELDQVIVIAGMPVVGEAGRQQAFDQGRGAAGLQAAWRLPVRCQPGAPVADRVEGLLAQGIGEHAYERLVSLPEGQRYAKDGEGVAEVTRAVNGVDDPGRRIAAAGDSRLVACPFLAEDEVVGESC